MSQRSHSRRLIQQALCEPPRQQRMRGALSPLVTSRTSVRTMRARHACAEAEVATEVHVEDRGARLAPRRATHELARRRQRAYWKPAPRRVGRRAALEEAIARPEGVTRQYPQHPAHSTRGPARACDRTAPRTFSEASCSIADGESRPTSDIENPPRSSVHGCAGRTRQRDEGEAAGAQLRAFDEHLEASAGVGHAVEHHRAHHHFLDVRPGCTSAGRHAGARRSRSVNAGVARVQVDGSHPQVRGQ